MTEFIGKIHFTAYRTIKGHQGKQQQNQAVKIPAIKLEINWELQ